MAQLNELNELPFQMSETTATCPALGCVYSPTGEPKIVAAQLTIHGMSHITNPNIKKPERPEVVQDMTESEWAKFVFNFTNYKRDSKIGGKDDVIRSELQHCCSKSVRSQIYQTKGEDLNTIGEADLLETIKTAYVNKISVTQHRN